MSEREGRFARADIVVEATHRIDNNYRARSHETREIKIILANCIARDALIARRFYDTEYRSV